jgi:TolB protein
MKRRELLLSTLSALGAGGALAQAPDIKVVLSGGQQATIALPDFLGAGDSSKWMALFNQTLFEEVFNSGVLKVAPKSFYPLTVPQRPVDWKPPVNGRSNGPWLSDWSGATVKANYIAIGYAAAQNGQMILYGWLYDVTQADLTNAQIFGKVYLGEMDEAGVKKVAREFAADILARFGAKSLVGSQIYFVSNRSGAKEIWSMDYDGTNQKQVTRFNSICITPTLSPDNSRLAFTSFLRGSPGITIMMRESARRLTFVNPDSSVVATPDFTPDGKQVYFGTKIGGGYTNIFRANADGSNLSRVTTARAVEVEPKVNPKTGTEVVFVSGRSGPEQIYRMSSEGTDVQRLTDGTGYAANPSWFPDGQLIAFCWTRGYEPGNYNIFVMDAAKRDYVQLTSDASKNTNPNWAPDRRHIVFCSKRSGTSQIWTMRADGTNLKQLTNAGINEMPVWSR